MTTESTIVVLILRAVLTLLDKKDATCTRVPEGFRLPTRDDGLEVHQRTTLVDGEDMDGRPPTIEKR